MSFKDFDDMICVTLVHCWCVLHTPDLTPSDMTGYSLGFTAGACPQQVKFTLPGYIFTHLGFPDCPCCLECNIFSRLCHDYGLMIFDYRMTDGYFLSYTELTLYFRNCLHLSLTMHWNCFTLLIPFLLGHWRRITWTWTNVLSSFKAHRLVSYMQSRIK